MEAHAIEINKLDIETRRPTLGGTELLELSS
jgi:hypothetical protein